MNNRIIVASIFFVVALLAIAFFSRLFKPALSRDVGHTTKSEASRAEGQPIYSNKKNWPSTEENKSELEDNEADNAEILNKWNKRYARVDEEGLVWLIQSVSEMAKMGKSGQALAMIQNSFGPGQNRNTLIRFCVSKADSLETIEDCFSRLEFDEERAYAQTGLSDFLARKAFETKDASLLSPLSLSFLKQTEKDKVFKTAVYEFFEESLASGDDHATQLGFLKNSISSDLPPEKKGDLLVYLSQQIPFLAWEHHSAIGLKDDEIDRKKIARRMFSTNPSSALEAVTENNNYELVELGVDQWMARDTSAPVRWYSENKESLSNEARDSVVAGIVNHSINLTEYEAAREWIMEMSDDERKNSFLQKLDSRSNNEE